MAWTKVLEGPVTVEYDTGRRHLKGSLMVNEMAKAEGALVVDLELAARMDFGAFAIMDAYGETYPATPAEAALAMARKLTEGR